MDMGDLSMAKAKAGKFRCSKCDRTFSMAAHLARHENAAHGAKPKRRAVRAKAARKRVGKRTTRKLTRRTRRSATGSPGSQPTPLLLQMQTYRNDLLAQRAEIASQIDAIDRALAAMGAATRTAGRRPVGRPPGGTAGPGSLKSCIAKVLRGHAGAMAVKDITAGVLSVGFQTRNKTLAKSVGIALGQMPDVRKVSRGMFCMK